VDKNKTFGTEINECSTFQLMRIENKLSESVVPFPKWRTLFSVVQFEMSWVMTSYNVVVGYQSFRGPCCLNLHVSIRGLLGCEAVQFCGRITTIQKSMIFQHLPIMKSGKASNSN